MVAKRQGREKPSIIEQRNVRGLQRGPQEKQTAVLASPVYIGQAQGEEKKHKIEEPKGQGSLSLTCERSLSLSLAHTFSVSLSLPLSLHIFLLACLHASRMYFPAVF